MKVCAEAVPFSTKRPPASTCGCRKRSPTTDLASIGLARSLHPPAASPTTEMPRCGEKCGLIMLIFLANIFSIVWADYLYGMFLGLGLPELIVKAIT